MSFEVKIAIGAGLILLGIYIMFKIALGGYITGILGIIFIATGMGVIASEVK